MKKRLAFALLAAVAAVAAVPAAGAGERALTVRSTLAGKSVLPHRVRWLGVPGAGAKVREVRFLVDGRLRWLEQHAPFTFGNDGNYLVTTWLKPGVHTFTVEAVGADGTRATATTQARVAPAPAPPARLA